MPQQSVLSSSSPNQPVPKAILIRQKLISQENQSILHNLQKQRSHYNMCQYVRDYEQMRQKVIKMKESDEYVNQMLSQETSYMTRRNQSQRQKKAKKATSAEQYLNKHAYSESQQS